MNDNAIEHLQYYQLSKTCEMLKYSVQRKSFQEYCADRSYLSSLGKNIHICDIFRPN